MGLKVGFYGLGIMGYPMAGHIQSKGSSFGASVVVYNRTESKSASWQKEHGGGVARSVSDLAQGKDVVVTCLSNDSALEEAILGSDGILANIPQGSTIVDHSTVSAEISKRIAREALAVGVNFLDAPVSGGEVGATKGVLTIMVGGDGDVLSSVSELLGVYSSSITHMGESGNGQLTKMANQICIAANYIGLAEAIKFAEVNGLDMELVFNAISKGSAGSWSMDNRFTTMHERKFDFGFPIYLIAKDLGLCLQQGAESDAPLMVTALLKEMYESLKGEHPTDDASALIRLLDRVKA